MEADDRVKIFKSIARDYNSYQDHIKGIDEKIEVIQHKMENVHSIDYDKVPSGTANFAERSPVELIEKKALLEKEKQYYIDLIQWVDEVIDSFSSGAVKALIWMSCVQRRSLRFIADKYGLSRDGLYKTRRAHLIRALNDEVMNRLDVIQQSAPAFTGAENRQ